MAKTITTPEIQSAEEPYENPNRDDSPSKPFSNNTRSANQRGENANPPMGSESNHELYTIPNYSSWFSWEDIHETERIHLKEFFDGSLPSRTPRIYKEYRDFIINKYREDPTRRLTFTELRKMIIGDVSLIHKVYRFLETWGLINFQSSDNTERIPSENSPIVSLEEGFPSGVRVISDPNAGKGVSANNAGEIFENGFKLPPVTSYVDVFSERILIETETEMESGPCSGMGMESTSSTRLVCGNCGEGCESGHYACVKGKFIICPKCFKSKNYGEGKSADDFVLKDSVNDASKSRNDVWTDAEIQCLLEAVLTHGNDWNLVANHVQTKSKLECISKLIQLPVGEHILGTHDVKAGNGNSSSPKNEKTHEAIKSEDENYEETGETKQPAMDVATTATTCPPLKRTRVASFADASSLMAQVALLSTAVGPHIAAAAAEAAFESLCDENPRTRKMLDAEEEKTQYEFGSATRDNEPQRVPKVEEDWDSEERNKESGTLETNLGKKFGPLTLRMRAAIATAFGAAAAHAKLLADQEEREIEHLMSTIIETQLRKIQYKIKHFEELEPIMEKEYAQIQHLKESLLTDRIDVLRETFSAGMLRWKDQSFAKSVVG